MSSVVPSIPQKINPKNLPDTTLDTSECLDLSIKEFFVIIYFHDSDPGNEYEILSEKDLLETWDTLEKGVIVMVKFGKARVQGTVITISDDLEYLKTNFKAITEEHQEAILEAKFKAKRQFCLQNQCPYGIYERHVIKVTDTGTQTEQPEVTNLSNNTEYVDLKRKYEDLKCEFDKFTSLFSEVKTGLQTTMMKLDNFSTKSSPPLQTLKPIDNKENVESFDKMVQIGREGTKISKIVYDSINWTSYTAATRKLLITLFPRKVLATHSLTGKPSPAFLTSDKQTKRRLNAEIISDIVELISKNCKVSESLVRNAITTKCADENKLYRKRMQKKRVDDAENHTDDDRKGKK